MNFDLRTSGNRRMRFAREGYPFMAGAMILAALAWVAVAISGSWTIVLASLLTVLTAFVFYFFRDPEREIPPGDGVVISPGDGKIIDIREVTNPPSWRGCASASQSS